MNSRLTRAERRRRETRRRAVLLSVIALVVIILIAAIVIILKETAGAGAGDITTSPATGDGTTAPSVIDARYPVSNAYDGDSATFTLVPQPQTVGSYIIITLGAETDVGSVGVISNHAAYFIRSASVGVSTDGVNYNEIGTFSGSADNSGAMSVTPDIPVRAKYVRIRLTADADESWIVNEIRVLDVAGTAAPVSGGEVSVIPPETGAATTAPETTASVQSGYISVLKSSDDIKKGELILVNNQYAYTFPESTAHILNIYENRTKLGTSASGKTIYSYFPGDYEHVSLGATALVQLNAMCDAFYNLTQNQDIYIPINGGYRSYATQQELLDKATVKANVAAPGSSEHHTGLSFDMKVWVYENGASLFYDPDGNNTSCQTILPWVTANAYKYGFVRRYPPDKTALTGISYDTWHYRYVGFAHAYYMTQHNLCLEEYLAYLAEFPYSGNHLIIDADDGKTYEIYFVAATGSVTTVPVPSAYTYTVSGNNYSGFIVTVTK